MIGIPKKATTLKEHNSYEVERIRKVHNKYLSVWINITIPEHNQEVTLYLQELTSTLLIQMPSQVRLQGHHTITRVFHDFSQSVSSL